MVTHIPRRGPRNLSVRIFAVCTLTLMVHSRVRAATSMPSLHIVKSPGHTLAVSGAHWGRRIVFTARIGDATAGVVLESLSGGRFTVAMDYGLACGGVSVEARDFKGHDLNIRRSGPMCPNRLGEPPPSISVLHGLRSAPHVRTLKHALGPRALTMHLGDDLHITEPGGLTPAFQPDTDAHYFILIDHRTVGFSACLAGPCDGVPEQSWTWVAVKQGSTSVGLTPACRLSRPPCEVAEAALSITIIR